jgi:hypothetical protein
MNDKNKLTLLKAIIFFLILIYIMALYQLHQTEPIKYIHGTYQNIDAPPLYTFTFNSYEGTYFISYSFAALGEGTFEQYDNNTYICYDKTGETFLLTLLHDGFLYYDSENEIVVKVAKKSDIPVTVIPIE